MDQTPKAIVEVAVEHQAWFETNTDIEQFCETTVAYALAASGKAPNGTFEVSVLLGDDRRIQDLNRDFRQQDKPTNVLSFPNQDPDGPLLQELCLLGDIALALETIEREALEQQKSFLAHLAHLLVHGTLHLLDFDHDNDDDAHTMETAETRIMTELGYPDPYADMEASV